MNKRSRRTRDMILAILFTLAITVCPCYFFTACIESMDNTRPGHRHWLIRLIWGETPQQNPKK